MGSVNVKGNPVRGLAAFAAGFGNGYMQGRDKLRQQKIEDERLALEKQRADLEAQRVGLENRKLQEEDDMHRKLAAISQESKPVQAFVVDTPEGRQVYTDKTTAQAAADSTPGAQVQPAFVVNGKTFSDKESAQAAADALNSPAVQMRRKAEIYSSYGREDLANAAMNNYKLMLDNNRREMVQAYLDARDKGADAVLNLYNKRLPDGITAKIVNSPQGQMLVTMKGDQVVSQKPFNEQQFLSDMDRRIAATPDNLAELWRADQQFGLQSRQVANQEKLTGAQVQHLNAQTADIPNQAQDRRIQAQAAATSAGAAATNARTAGFNAQTERAKALTPQLSAVPGQDGGLNFVTIPKTLDPQGGITYGQPQVTPIKGLKHPGAYSADARNSLGLPGGLGSPGAPGFALTPDMIEALKRANGQ